jgi:transmembrane 9 superfamily protein 2/4
MKSLLETFVLSLLFTLPLSQAFYLPGVAPHDYQSGEKVALNVNSLTPSNQQVNSVISYDFYNDHFHFCKPSGGTQKQSESIGSVLFGDRIFNSAFEV